MTDTSPLNAQYGGNSRSGWLRYLPQTWLPYVQLARLSPPAGLFLIYFPHLFGALHASIVTEMTVPEVLRACALTFGGSFFVSNAIHIWNDLIDAPLDAQVERTRHRPIPRGAVSPLAAFIFTVSQALGAGVFLHFSPGGLTQSAVYAMPGILGWTYYPYAKRHTYYPQFVLGFCLSWGLIMGSLAGRMAPLTLESDFCVRVQPSSLCLFGACTLWAMIYDTIYAHQDLADDKKAGIKSLAVLYENRTKPLLWKLLATMTALLISCGALSGMSVIYYGVAVLGSVAALGTMVWSVDLSNSRSCWMWFKNGFWLAGGSIAGGLLMEYVAMA